MLDQKSPANQSELDQALALFHFAFRAFTTGPDKILGEYGLQRVHHRILYFVGRNPALSVNALLRILGVSKQALNGPLRTLVENGLILTAQDNHDRRIKRLSLSEQGEALEEALSNSQRRLLREIFDEAGASAEQQWRTIMHQIASSQFAHLLPEMLQPAPGEQAKKNRDTEAPVA